MTICVYVYYYLRLSVISVLWHLSRRHLSNDIWAATIEQPQLSRRHLSNDIWAATIKQNDICAIRNFLLFTTFEQRHLRMKACFAAHWLRHNGNTFKTRLKPGFDPKFGKSNLILTKLPWFRDFITSSLQNFLTNLQTDGWLKLSIGRVGGNDFPYLYPPGLWLVESGWARN